MKRILFITAILTFVSFTIYGQAIPKQISYQGVLKNAAGVNVTDGSYSLVFKIYNEPTGGTPLWTEPQSVTVKNGFFSAQLGSVTPITTVSFDRLHFLGLTIGTGTELLPRTMLTPSPYSFMSMDVMENTISTNKLQDAAVTGVKIKSNEVVKSLNGLKDNVNLVAGTNVTLVPSGNNLTINATPGTGGITGSGTTNYLPLFTASTTLGNSNLSQDVSGNIQTGLDGTGKWLILSANDNVHEGGQIKWNGAATYDDWLQDSYINNMRFFTNSANTNTVEIFNSGTGTTGLYVQGSVGIGTTTPTTKLHILGTSPIFRLADGTQATGKILVSDANGNASWQDNSNYHVSNNLNNTSINASTTWQKIGDYLTFTKIAANSVIEVYLNSNVRGGTFNSASGVSFEVRVDNVASSIDNKGSINLSGEEDFISIMAVFTGLSTGSHTVSVWAKANTGTTTNTSLDPGGWGGKILAKETF